jgi:hypothetical protein
VGSRLESQWDPDWDSTGSQLEKIPGFFEIPLGSRPYSSGIPMGSQREKMSGFFEIPLGSQRGKMSGFFKIRNYKKVYV